MHRPTDRITQTTAFVTPVVEHWLEREIAQWGMYVYVYMCVCIDVCMHVYMCMYVYMMYTYMYKCMHVWLEREIAQ